MCEDANAQGQRLGVWSEREDGVIAASNWDSGRSMRSSTTC